MIGGSMSGLLAARVLSEFYEKVTIIERDDLSAATGWRCGVPQSRHAHGLLASGLRVLEELCPEIRNELEALGAMAADTLNDARWFFEDGVLSRVPSGTTGMLISRPALEKTFRASIKKNSEHRDNRKIIGLRHTARTRSRHRRADRSP